MTMKRTDLAKRQAFKLENQRKQNDAARFGRPASDTANTGADGKPRKPSLMDALLARTKKD